MVDKGCDNCYYTYFDEKAYPCSLCIRGVERTDQWQPRKKTKADTPQTEEPYIDIETGILHWCGWEYRRIEDEPQTDCGWK